MFDPRVEKHGNLIKYHIETNENIHLSDASLHDIFTNVREVASYWKEDSDKLRKENHALRWNELRLWIKRTNPEGGDQILNVMALLDEGKSVRNYPSLTI